MKDFIKRVRFDPYWRAFAEIFITVVFTFFPILLFSVPVMEGGDQISKDIIVRHFWSYWSSGELVLPILGVCGTLVAVIALNSEVIAGFWRAFGLLAAAVVAIGGGYLLGTNRGFEKNLLSEVVMVTFLVYLIIVILWFVLSVIVNHGPSGGVDSEGRVKSLLAEKAAREAKVR